MSLRPITFNDFSGGMNRDTAPHLLSAGEMLDAQDVILGERGVIRRRGNYTNLRLNDQDTAETVFPGKFVCAGQHVHRSRTHGVFGVVSTRTETKLLWWVPNWNWVEVFDYGYPSSQGAVRAGFTPPNRKDRDADKRNARYNATIISCDAFTVAAKVTRNEGGFPGGPGTNQFRTERTVQVGGEDVVYHFEFTVILCAADDGLGNSPETRVPAVMARQNPCPFAETVNRFTFLAGDTALPQHYRWSQAENCHLWDEDDKEHAATGENDQVQCLAVISGMLAIVKERSIFTLRVIGKPPGPTTSTTQWELSQSTKVGTLDGRSVASFGDGIVFASHSGVYLFDHNHAPRNLADGKINMYLRQLLRGWTQNHGAVGVVVGEHYILTLKDDNGQLIETLSCHIPTRAWCRFSNINLAGSVQSTLGRAVYGFLESGRVVNLTSMFVDADGVDVEGTGPSMVVELPRITTDDTTRMKTWRKLDIDYEATAGRGSPRLRVDVIQGIQYPAPSGHQRMVGEFPPQGASGLQPQQCFFNVHDRALGVRLSESVPSGAAFDKIVVQSVSVRYRASRSGKVNS